MKRKILAWALLIAWMAIIFIFSHQPAIESNELSTAITTKVVDAVIRLIPKANINPAKLNHFIRKGAHFSVYLVLGSLTVNALTSIDKFKPDSRRVQVFLIALGICLVYAISDEIHQVFIPGRSGEIRDVLLDSMGALAGIVIMTIIRVKCMGRSLRST